MSSSISGLHYEENQIGGAFKSSKTDYIWEFILNGSSPNKIELISSNWTGKKRLIKNGVEVFDKNNDDSFLKNFEIDGHIFSIIQYGGKFELRVDNQSFTHLYNLERNKHFFTGEDDPTSKTQIAKSFTDNLSSENDENNLYKNKNNEKKNEKPGLFDFKIKVDESKQNSGLKKFKFGPGVKPSNSGLKNKENNKNTDLLGFGDIIQSNSNTSPNNNDIFGLGIINNNESNQNNQYNNNDLLNFGNSNNNNNDFLNFDSNENNNIEKPNSSSKSTNDQLADIFSAFAQNNNNNQANENNKTNIENAKSQQNNEENKENQEKNNIFVFDPSSVNNQTNLFNSNQNELNSINNNNLGFFNPEEKKENEINNENEDYPKLDEINNQNNNNIFTFNFVPQENNNQGFQPPPSGFDYEAFNNAKKNQPTTNNDKLDNALQNLF